MKRNIKNMILVSLILTITGCSKNIQDNYITEPSTVEEESVESIETTDVITETESQSSYNLKEVEENEFDDNCTQLEAYRQFLEKPIDWYEDGKGAIDSDKFQFNVVSLNGKDENYLLLKYSNSAANADTEHILYYDKETKKITTLCREGNCIHIGEVLINSNNGNEEFYCWVNGGSQGIWHSYVYKFCGNSMEWVSEEIAKFISEDNTEYEYYWGGESISKDEYTFKCEELQANSLRSEVEWLDNTEENRERVFSNID